ncbi:hypothetical protein EMCRGX_G020267 [Ephydatia muelleri]
MGLDTSGGSLCPLCPDITLDPLGHQLKCWMRYLEHNSKGSKTVLNLIYERALKELPGDAQDMDGLLQFLMDQCKVTRTRRTFDRALQALPLTQHNRIWPLYIKSVKTYDLPETTETFMSRVGKSKHQLWQELCQLISKHPNEITTLKIEPIIRGGLRCFTDMIALLHHPSTQVIHVSFPPQARDVYEEAIQTVTTVRDFGQVFDAYAQFEESMISAKMEMAAEMGASEEDDLDLELRLERYETLMDRRPLLLSSVLLRQNPHNVHEWHKRVALLEGKPREIINTYTEAVQTVDINQAVGRPHTLWV